MESMVFVSKTMKNNEKPMKINVKPVKTLWNKWFLYQKHEKTYKNLRKT